MSGFRLALLISGGGTTMAAIIEACQSGRLSGMTPACVISSRPDAGGVERAKRLGILEKDILIFETKKFPDNKVLGEAMLGALRDRGVTLIGQYGWHIKTPPFVIEAYEGKIINQHPGPLDTGRPDFGGKGMFGRRVHAARLFFARSVGRDFWTEATAHRVEAEYDTGAVLKRRQVEILPDDDANDLQARVLPIEHEVQIETLEDFMYDRVRELVREAPLVRGGEEPVLEAAKKAATLLFPSG